MNPAPVWVHVKCQLVVCGLPGDHGELRMPGFARGCHGHKTKTKQNKKNNGREQEWNFALDRSGPSPKNNQNNDDHTID
jgi:hypothetical protein